MRVCSQLPEREEGEGEETPAFSHWGAPRRSAFTSCFLLTVAAEPRPLRSSTFVCACRVEVWPEGGQSLGLSIVGGRHTIKRLKNGEELKGIFIKQVLPGSPAALSGCLKTGDKILEVGYTHTGVWLGSSQTTMQLLPRFGPGYYLDCQRPL